MFQALVSAHGRPWRRGARVAGKQGADQRVRRESTPRRRCAARATNRAALQARWNSLCILGAALSTVAFCEMTVGAIVTACEAKERKRRTGELLRLETPGTRSSDQLAGVCGRAVADAGGVAQRFEGRLSQSTGLLPRASTTQKVHQRSTWPLPRRPPAAGAAMLIRTACAVACELCCTHARM